MQNFTFILLQTSFTAPMKKWTLVQRIPIGLISSTTFEYTASKTVKLINFLSSKFLNEIPNNMACWGKSKINSNNQTSGKPEFFFRRKIQICSNLKFVFKNYCRVPFSTKKTYNMQIRMIILFKYIRNGFREVDSGVNKIRKLVILSDFIY